MGLDNRLDKEELIAKYLDEKDLSSSSTALMVRQYLEVLSHLNNVNSVVDLGSGYGGIALLIGNYLHASSIIGIERDKERVEYSKSKGLETICGDVSQMLPFGSDTTDLVLSNGVLCHLPFFDPVLRESARILHRGGHLVLTLPNMANFIQRIILLTGHQPNDAQVSDTIRTGSIFMNKTESSTHIHGATVSCITELLEYYRYGEIRVYKGNPTLIGKYAQWNTVFRLLGKVLPVTLSRRLIVIAEKM